jgi:hypothetical protein
MAGLDGSREVLLPLSTSAQSTLTNLARHANGVLRVSPFCHVGEHNEVKGWVLDMPGDAPACALPLNCTFFDGVSVVECECTEAEALQLLTRPEETRAALGQAIHGVMSRVTEDRRATWRRCRPTENGVPPSLYSAVMGRDNQVTLCTTPDAVPLIDSEPWVPELSPEGFVGLFHHWHPVRKRLCIYMACQSYLPKACLEFADLVRDLGDACSSWDILHSEEAQWLRHACARNRARILAMVCEGMGLRCPCMLDYCNAEQGKKLAVVCSETLHHDMMQIGAGDKNRAKKNKALSASWKEEEEALQVLGGVTKRLNHIRVLNHCAMSGGQGAIACSMAPWEGIWLFECGAVGQLFMPTCTAQQEQELLALPHHARVGVRQGVPSAPHETRRCTFTNPQKVTADRLEVLHVWEHQKQEASFLQQHCLRLLCEAEEKEGMQHPHAEEEARLMRLMMTQPYGRHEKEEEDHPQDDEELTVAYKRSIAKRLSRGVKTKEQDEEEARVGERWHGGRKEQRVTQFLVFDEHILQCMVDKGWNRTHGYTVLMPLAYGQCKEWWKHMERLRRCCTHQNSP